MDALDVEPLISIDHNMFKNYVNNLRLIWFTLMFIWFLINHVILLVVYVHIIVECINIFLISEISANDIVVLFRLKTILTRFKYQRNVKWNKYYPLLWVCTHKNYMIFQVVGIFRANKFRLISTKRLVFCI